MKKKKNIPRLNIKDYSKNAAKKFSVTKILIYLFVSAILGTLLVISTIQEKYTGTPLIFCSIVILIVFGFVVLNIIALVNKLKEK